MKIKFLSSNRYHLMAVKLTLIALSILSISAPEIVLAEEVNYTNRQRYTRAGLMKNSKQTLCKGAKLNPGILTAGDVSSIGDWQPFSKLINNAGSSTQKEKLLRRAITTYNTCFNNKNRIKTQIIPDAFWWYDTEASNSMEQNDTLYTINNTEFGELTLYTDNTDVNIHSHYLGFVPRARKNRGIEYTGEFMVSSNDGGIGVTFLSNYPSSDSYYRLRRLGWGSFHLTTHPDTSGQRELIGTTDTLVNPTPNIWYRFKIQAFASNVSTKIRARVWPASDKEPKIWQVDAEDTTAEKYKQGRFGVWSMSHGRKNWRKLAFRFVSRR